MYWIVGALLIAALFLLIIHLSANNLEFSRMNTGWNGTSAFFSDLDRHKYSGITNPEELAGYTGNSTLIIIAPYRSPTPEELAAYRAFLDAGNTLILADDFGAGNAILTGLDSRISVLPGHLASLDRQYSDPYSVIAYRSLEESPVPLPPYIELNQAAPLDGGTPLMLTSVMSWADTNGDRRLNTVEEMGTFPVMVITPLGKGRLIVLSDPSIFINSMYTQEENMNNRDLISTLVTGDGPVLIDQMNSRTADTRGLGEILQLVRNNQNSEILLVSFLMLGAAWAWKRRIV